MHQQKRILVELISECEMDGGGMFARIRGIGASATRTELTHGRREERQTRCLKSRFDIVGHFSTQHLGGELGL
jgi:hypothetical protein